MGNSCSHVNNNGNPGHHHPIKPKVYVPQNQAVRSRPLSGNRQGNPATSAVPDVQYVPASRGILTTLNEIQKAQGQEVAPLIIAATAKIQKADTEQAEKVVPVTIVVTANTPKENIDEKELAPATVAAAENIQKADIEEELAQATTAATNREDTEEHEIALATTVATAGINREATEEQEITPATTAVTADFQRVDTEEHKVAPATTHASENQVEGNNIFRSNEDRSTSSDSTLGPDDAWKESMSSNLPFLPVIDDDDECPTCLDGYNTENPKIMTRCRHHYHLGCIYEWMERSATCPMCSEVMEFDEDC